MISDLDTTVVAPAQKRRGVKPEPIALISVGEAPNGFWVVTSNFDESHVVAVLIPKGLTAAQRALAVGLSQTWHIGSPSLAKSWDLDAVFGHAKWLKDFDAMATVAPLPFPRAQRLIFA